MRSKIEPMKEMARTLRRYHAILLNWFATRGEISNGSVEWMHSKAKLAMRKAHGFIRNTKRSKSPYITTIGKLPEQVRTHRFC